MPGYRAGVKPYRAGYPDASSGRRMNSVELDADKSVVVEARRARRSWPAPYRHYAGGHQRQSRNIRPRRTPRATLPALSMSYLDGTEPGLGGGVRSTMHKWLVE